MIDFEQKIEKAIDRFETAAINLGALGAIPLFSDDPEEQRDIDHTRRYIKREYGQARAALKRLMVHP